MTCRALGTQAGVWAHARWAGLRAFPPPSALTCEGSQASAELREGSCLLTRWQLAFYGWVPAASSRALASAPLTSTLFHSRRPPARELPH